MNPIGLCGGDAAGTGGGVTPPARGWPLSPLSPLCPGRAIMQQRQAHDSWPAPARAASGFLCYQPAPSETGPGEERNQHRNRGFWGGRGALWGISTAGKGPGLLIGPPSQNTLGAGSFLDEGTQDRRCRKRTGRRTDEGKVFGLGFLFAATYRLEHIDGIGDLDCRHLGYPTEWHLSSGCIGLWHRGPHGTLWDM